jgi:3-keto-5-aminohexanoate cleavage enzyme
MKNDPLVITVAPTGAENTREHNPNIPYTPEEIAAESIASAAAGAAVVHLHVRNADGSPSTDKELYAAAIGRIREETDAVTMVTTGGAVVVGGMLMDDRIQGIYADPDVISLQVGSINFGGEPFITSRADTLRIAAEGRRLGMGFEIQAKDVGHVAAGAAFIAEGVLPETTAFNLVVGVPGGMPADVGGLTAMVAQVPAGSRWGVTAVGPAWHPLLGMLTTGIALGADCVRVGFEDCVYLRPGVLAGSNAELVEQIRDLAELLGRTIGGTDDARRYFGLQPRSAAAV